jgi:hypothetical protein
MYAAALDEALPQRPVTDRFAEEEPVTIAMQTPGTTDDLLDAGLADLVDAVTAPAAPVPSPEVVALLARATGLLGGRDLRAATRSAAERLERSIPAGDPIPAELSDAVWALVEAARVLDDKALGWRALAVAGRISTRTADPAAAACAGLAQLRLWLAFRDRPAAGRVRERIEALIRSAEQTAGGVRWSGTDDLPAIGTFLLAASRETGPLAGLRTAEAVAATLHAAGPATSADDASFLVRHAAATGDRRSQELARAAAEAGPDTAATGELLLDLAALDPTGDHRDRAEVLATRLTGRPGPAELSFLLRLRHGGTRPWHIGDLETGPLRFRP